MFRLEGEAPLISLPRSIAVQFEMASKAALKLRAGSREKRLDKKWHPVENASRAVSAFPLYVSSLPFRIAGNSLRGDRWRKKMA